MNVKGILYNAPFLARIDLYRSIEVIRWGMDDFGGGNVCHVLRIYLLGLSV